MTMVIKNHNFRFNLDKAADKRAWELLKSEQIKTDFKSQNEFVIKAINYYYDRYFALKDDPYLETREKEDAFTSRIIIAVYERLSGLGNIFGTGSGDNAVIPQNNSGNNASSVLPPKSNSKESTTNGSEMMNAEEPEDNEYLDYGFAG